MTAGNDFDPGPPQPELFSALLTPHRSLNRTGFLVLMAFLSMVSFAAGLAFLLMGAWPVLGFFCLDVLAVYWAFRVNFLRARATEQISVTPSELRVRRVSHRGRVVEWVLNPLWVQIDQKIHAEFGIEKLYLVSRGRRVTIASFLGPDEKASFAKALLAALHAARRGPTYNPLGSAFILTRFLHPNRYLPWIKSGAGFGSETLWEGCQESGGFDVPPGL